MYAEYWGLTALPFSNQPDARWFHESPGHEEALARMLFLVEERRHCGLLFGDAGTGRSQLLAVLVRQLRRSQRLLVSLDLLSMGPRELLWNLAAQLGLNPGLQLSAVDLWRRIQDQVYGNQQAGLQTVFLFDHVERAEEGCLPALERLLHLPVLLEGGITCLFSIRNSEPAVSLGRLTGLSDLRIELAPLNRDESRNYVIDLIEKVGGHAATFTPAALDRLFEFSGGLPRELNRLCDLALLGGMADGHSHVGEELVIGAAEDLHFSPATSRPRSTTLAPV